MGQGQLLPSDPLGALLARDRPTDPPTLAELRSALAGARGVSSEAVTIREATATDARNDFAAVLDHVTRHEVVLLTTQGAPRAVILSLDDLGALLAARPAPLQGLSDEFDALLARMQTDKATRGMKRAFESSGKELGAAAVRGARKSKRRGNKA